MKSLFAVFVCSLLLLGCVKEVPVYYEVKVPVPMKVKFTAFAGFRLDYSDTKKFFLAGLGSIKEYGGQKIENLWTFADFYFTRDHADSDIVDIRAVGGFGYLQSDIFRGLWPNSVTHTINPYQELEFFCRTESILLENIYQVWYRQGFFQGEGTEERPEQRLRGPLYRLDLRTGLSKKVSNKSL